jgi:hypothetical protein
MVQSGAYHCHNPEPGRKKNFPFINSDAGWRLVRRLGGDEK